MKVSAPVLGPSPRGDDLIRVEAKATYDGLLARSDHIWFDLPRDLKPEISRTGDPWLTALLPLAVALGESMTLVAPVSEMKLANAKKLMAIWSDWYPWLQPVPIEALAIEVPRPEGSGRVGCFFSGGVDSFFTLLHDREEGGGTIDDLIFIEGGDIPLKNEQSLGRARRSLARLARQGGLELIPIATNLRETRFDEVNFDYLGNGAFLGAVGLILGTRYRRVFISSTWPHGDLLPLGSHPKTDPLLANDQTHFVHYGSWADRIAKTEYVSRFEEARANLRVCWESGSARNCGQCLKCLRTMVVLEVVGRLTETPAFDQGQLDLELVRRQVFTRDERYFRRLLPFARQQAREDVAGAISAAFRRTERIRRWMLFGLIPEAHRHLMHRPAARRLLRGPYHGLRRLAVWINDHLA